jgi:hypothetical protein
MLKRTEPALTEITQRITIERTVGVEPEVVAQWHTTHGLEKIEALHQRRSAKSGRVLADQIGD